MKTEIQKIKYLEKEQSFKDEITSFIVFEGLSFGDKKNLLKNSGQKL